MKSALKIVMLNLILSSISMGAEFSGNVKIKSIQNVEPESVIIEFEKLDRSHFSTMPDNVKKLKFDYLKWPKDSRNNSLLEKLMFWKRKPVYKKEEFDKCLNWMIENHKNGKEFILGQVGGGSFEFFGDAVIVPYLHFKEVNNSENICLIDLG
ncbi:hypothetical protein CIK05_06680 [Bdellovibrio sp. qaytius]|nr:hypothetical protein CIK05_06680 [Bdellovibrio sp. qaytius]